MIFLANIGNTNLTCGLYNNRIFASVHYPVNKFSGKKDVLCFFNQYLRDSRVTPERIEKIILSSVVPEKTSLIFNAARDFFHLEPVLISEKTEWEFDHSSYSGILGTDRLLCCSAALKKYKPPFIVVDLGTAVTLNIMDSHGDFIGGAILPGVSTGLRALAGGTSQLSDMSRRLPFSSLESVIGKNTGDCLLAGATYGTAYILKGFYEKIQIELRADAAMVITGGNAKDIIPYLDFNFHYERNLLLEGLALQSCRHDRAVNVKEKTYESKW